MSDAEVEIDQVSGQVNPNGQITVVAPSGAVFVVLNENERAYFEDRAGRYLSDNHLTNITDLQDIDRLLIMETMCWRYGLWLSQEYDYWGQTVDLDTLKKTVVDYSKELRLLKKTLGIDKASRDRDKGESFSDYLENLRERAKEFIIMREEQSVKSITLFKDLEALITMYHNCDERERQEQGVTIEDVIEWIDTVAIPEFRAIDDYFTTHSQRYWIRQI